MAMKYGEHLTRGEEHYIPPFEPDSAWMGQKAHELGALELPDPTPWATTVSWTKPWTPDDEQTLDYFLMLEKSLPAMRASPEFDSDSRNQLNLHFRRLVADYHAALPFNDSERRWLVKTEYPPKSEDEGEIPAPRGIPRIYYAEGDIMAAGIRQVVRGRDLIDRWRRWRCGLDEFEGQGSMAAACETLTGLGVLLEAEGINTAGAPVPEVFEATEDTYAQVP